LSPVVDLIGSRADWVQPRSSERRFELRGDGWVFGRLEFRSWGGSLAYARMSEGVWTFKRVGFFDARVTVRRSDDEVDLASFRPRLSGSGTLNGPAGSALHWSQASFWRSCWIFRDAVDTFDVEFRPGAGKTTLADRFKTQVTVELRRVEAHRDVLPIVVPLGLYLILLQEEDAAAAAAIG
jgi:hypothetical protein